MPEGSSDGDTEDIVGLWERKIESLYDEMLASEEYDFEEVESSIDLEDYRVKKLSGGEYIISTPGFTIDFSGRGHYNVHEKGRKKPGRTEFDIKLEELIERELENAA